MHFVPPTEPPVNLFASEIKRPTGCTIKIWRREITDMLLAGNILI
jgi:hypothetical protein